VDEDGEDDEDENEEYGRVEEEGEKPANTTRRKG